MGTSITDLMPKNFTVKIGDVELQCKPLRLSHALIVGKIGDVFQNPKNYNSAEIKQAEKDIDVVIAELVPELKGVELGITELVELIPQLMTSSQPSDDKELRDAGVRFDTDPKAPNLQTEATG